MMANAGLQLWACVCQMIGDLLGPVLLWGWSDSLELTKERQDVLLI